MIRLMTLNLYRHHGWYPDWDRRSANIISLINEQKPDVIALQEVMMNPAFSDWPVSDLIGNKCNYKYRVYAPTLPRNNGLDRESNRTQHISEGQAFISKYPIVTSESYFPKQYPECPEDVSVLFSSIDIDGALADLCNVHFVNNDISIKQLDELLNLIKKRRVYPIILGDFNIYKLADKKNKLTELNSYLISSEKLDYISYPADNDSLDYIIVPKSKYDLNRIICHDGYVSDHKALSAILDLR